MSNTIRVSHNKNYTCISNNAIRDNRLSYKARGIHHLLLSYPDNWIINVAQLSSDEASKEDGATSVTSALKELEKFGYLRRLRTRNEYGHITGWEQVLFELPPTDNRVSQESGYPRIGLTDNRVSQESGFPRIGLTDNRVSQESENQALINTVSKEVIKELNTSPLTPQGENAERKASQSQDKEVQTNPSSPDKQAKSVMNKTISHEAKYSGAASIDSLPNSDERNIEAAKKMLSSAQKCDRQFEKLAPWRNSKKRNDYNAEFIEYLKTEYLLTTSHYREKGATEYDAKNWIAKREFDEQKLSELENRYSEFTSKKKGAHAYNVPDFSIWYKHQHEILYRESKISVASEGKYTDLSPYLREWEEYARINLDYDWRHLEGRK